MARGRLKSLMRRLSQDQSVLTKYNAVIEEQRSLGIIEPVQIRHTPQLTHYLPHHCVVQASNTTKVRVVYDASARPSKSSPSLNDCLYQGPSLLPDLRGILLRFRQHPVGICSDIEKAFLQLNLHPQDRDVTRFLWVKDIHQPVTENNLQAFRFCRVSFGIIASPFLLSATIRHHLLNEGTEHAAEILRNTYVDNILLSKPSATEALSHYESAKSSFASASMNLREWSSNSTEVTQQLPVHDRAESVQVKCLGLLWNTEKDTLSVSSPNAASVIVNTKRQVLQGLSRFFDPLGLLSPIFIRAKTLLQDIWKLNVEWDEPLPPELLARWRLIATDMDTAADSSFPRYIEVSSQPLQLHVFCDASEVAYAVVAYVRSCDPPRAALVFSKSCVAPLKSQSIPRLELMAAVLGTRIVQFIRQQLTVELISTYLWTDSTTVLHWISSSQKLPLFVKNRVEAIRSVPDVEFRYVKSVVISRWLSSRKKREMLFFLAKIFPMPWLPWQWRFGTGERHGCGLGLVIVFFLVS